MVNDGELWLSGVHIPEYTEGTWTNHTPRRERKLLVNKAELNKLIA
jgi:SsrA-binding protein